MRTLIRDAAIVTVDAADTVLPRGDLVIENGRLGAPIKGVTLIGNGPDVLSKVTAVGTDYKLSDGRWTCGKDGQSVPVGVGMPTVLVSGITVGGTEQAVGGGALS